MGCGRTGKEQQLRLRTRNNSLRVQYNHSRGGKETLTRLKIYEIEKACTYYVYSQALRL